MDAADVTVDGVLVQLPLPKHVTQKTVLSAISVTKDGGCSMPELCSARLSTCLFCVQSTCVALCVPGTKWRLRWPCGQRGSVTTWL